MLGLGVLTNRLNVSLAEDIGTFSLRFTVYGLRAQMDSHPQGVTSLSSSSSLLSLQKLEGP